MAPFRGRGPARGSRGGGRGGGSRGGRGGPRGGGGGGFRGASRGGPRGGFQGGRGGRVGRGGRSGRGGRGGRTGRDEFRSGRVDDLEEPDSDSADGDDDGDQDERSMSDQEGSGAEDSEDDAVATQKARAYNALLQSFQQASSTGEPQRKRRRIEIENASNGDADNEDQDEEALVQGEDMDTVLDDDDDDVDGEENGELQDEDVVDDIGDEDEDVGDPFGVHFANPDDNELSRRLNSININDWRTEKIKLADEATVTTSQPASAVPSHNRKPIQSVKQLNLKKRLADTAQKHIPHLGPLEQALTPHIYNYEDVLCGARTVENAASLRRLASLHALNHIYKGRDRVLKNNARLAQAEDDNDLELRDQGFTRPKVLFLLETRQACVKYIETLMDICDPEQQENKKRFQDGFVQTETKFGEDRPADFLELFEGNDDNDFRLGIKLTRKTVKYFSAFYSSDIILASPLGLRRIIEHEDPKKADSDFLSSIEIIVVDQADAMLMQNWEHVEFVFQHLNLQPKDAHGCDFSRVRNWYLDGKAKYLRQTIVFSAFIAPELNRLYNSSMQNIAGKAKYSIPYDGAITQIGISIKQTFSRYDSASPASDPDDRFKYFTSAIVPALSRYPKPAEGGQGTLLFIPSYLDFVRVRNYFANSAATQHVSFGVMSEYTDVSTSRRARSHFFTGRHSVLLYTGRAHHFHRYRIRGVKRVVLYGLPENPTFYREIVGGFLGQTIAEGKLDEGEAAVRAVFSRWDGLKLERVVGTKRVAAMLREKSGDTFDFV
ncbi:hypothetical protein MBLNU459_g6275t1 [Dothideomycetes sp. NU459]